MEELEPVDHSVEQDVFHKKVKTANKLGANVFSVKRRRKRHTKSTKQIALKNNLIGTLESSLGSNLPSSVFQWATDLFQTNMKEFYDMSNFGFDMGSKEAEMTASTSRYLIARISPQPQSSSQQPLLAGFCHYRFDMDFGFPVVYCYELQIEKKFQGCGLGKIFIETLENIARKTGMLKISATVFKFNLGSDGFFRKLGFVDDPDALVDSDCDYHLLCKFVNS